MSLLGRIVQRQTERQFRVPSPYLGHLGEASPSGLWKFLLFLPASAHRVRVSRDLFHAVRLVATRHEDCGTCVQIVVNMAVDDGVAPRVLRAVLDRDIAGMPEPVALAVRFAEGVLARDGSEDQARTELAQRYGAPVVAELSLAIASARVFPTLKRGMGFATSCSLVSLDLEGQR